MFNRVKIRRIRGEKEKGSAGFSDQFLCYCALVKGRIVHHNDMGVVQVLTQLLFEPTVKDFRIAYTLKQKRFFKFFPDTRSNQRRKGMLFSCNQPMGALSFWRIAIATGRVRAKSTFIDINERFAAAYIAFTKAKILFSSYFASLSVPGLFFFQVILSRLRLYQMQ